MALPRDVVTLSDEQFAKLIELLTPGYEMAKAMMEDRARVADWAEDDKPKQAPEASDDKKDEAQ